MKANIGPEEKYVLIGPQAGMLTPFHLTIPYYTIKLKIHLFLGMNDTSAQEMVLDDY